MKKNEYIHEFFSKFPEEDELKRKFLLLIIYDIVENKKRVRLSKFLDGYGRRIQKSAYEAVLDEKKFKEILKNIGQFANEEDSIRIYKLSHSGEIYKFGRKEHFTENEVIII